MTMLKEAFQEAEKKVGTGRTTEANELTSPQRTRRTYSDRFKSEAVALVLEAGRTPVEVAEKLGIHPANVNRWLAVVREKHQPSRKESSPTELTQLRKENERLRFENEVLSQLLDTMSKKLGVDIKITSTKV